MSQLVSVIMPAYNCAATVVESVRSVLAQTYPHFELIIVDDCSMDATPAVLQELAATDPRVVVHRHAQNGGVAAARNTGISLSRGRYIAFLDADDLWAEQKLALQIDYMATKKLDFTYTDYSVFKVSDGVRTDLGVRRLPSSLRYRDLLQRGYTLGTLSVVLNRDFLGDVRFRKIGHEDFALWLQLLGTNTAVAFKVPSTACLAYYRVSGNSVSSSKYKAAKWMWTILSSQQGVGRVRAAYGFLRYAIRSAVRLA